MGTMSGPRVLIADDDPWSREILTLLLREEGFETLEATTGVEVMDRLLLSPGPLLVLLDLVMPTMTGFEVLAQVGKDDALAARHRFIVLSARPYTKAIEIGPHFADLLQRLDVAFVEKPFDLEHLVSVVRAAYSHLIPPERRLDPPYTA